MKHHYSEILIARETETLVACTCGVQRSHTRTANVMTGKVTWRIRYRIHGGKQMRRPPECKRPGRWA